MVRRYELFQSSDTLFIIEILSWKYYERRNNIIEIFVALIVGIVGSIIATYLVRLIDKLGHKNNRHER
nr:MAG TPA: TM helix protein [Caudoviricetes sp.]